MRQALFHTRLHTERHTDMHKSSRNHIETRSVTRFDGWSVSALPKEVSESVNAAQMGSPIDGNVMQEAAPCFY